MLYKRDYKILTKDELSKWKKAEAYLTSAEKRNEGLAPSALIKYYELLPKAAQHCRSIFPNNYMDIWELKSEKRLLSIKKRFTLLLQKKPPERQILDFIKTNEAYFVLGSIFSGYYDFGHHEAYVFREFKLPPNFITDYLLVGKNSGGFEFIFVELEDANTNITTKDGSFGLTIRKGLKQIEDWNTWIESNFSNLKLVFRKYEGSYDKMPSEFFDFDKSRIHYALVAGRRSNYTQKTYRLRRKLRKENNITLLHYDNLLDGINRLMEAKTY